MRRTALACLLSLLCAVAARAAPSFVQSGEHDGFTRLVAELPSSADWEVARAPGQVVLSLEGHGEGFDISRVFELIPRDRIAAVETGDDSLTVTLGCDCTVSAFAVGSTHVALDVASPGVDLATPLVPAPDTTRVEPLPAAPARPVSRPSRPTPLDREPLSHAAQAALEEVQQTLLRELGTAATQGVLDPAPGLPPLTPQRPHVDPAGFDDALPATPDPMEEEVMQTMNIRITSSMDLPEGQRGPGSVLDGIAVCPSPETLALADWGEDAPFAAQLGAARQALFGEFDQIDRAAALRLARLYLHFGFGAEAADVLALDPALAAENPLLTHVAAVLEGSTAATSPALSAVAGCDGNTALWALLSGMPPGEDDAEVVKAALLAMNDLPAHLRGILAPALSRALLARKDSAGAAQALRSLERLPDDLPPAAELAQAHLKEQQGETDAAEQQFEKIARQNSAESPEALIALVKARARAHEPIGTEIAELVEAYAKELKDSPLAPELRSAHVAALTQSGQYDRAFTAVATLGPEEPGVDDLRRQLIRALTDAAPEVTFLRRAFDLGPQDLAGLDPPDLIAVARRMLDTGFAGPAQGVLALLPDRPLNTERQLLEAEIALALSQPFRAQAALLGIEDARATRLLADAKRMGGTYAEASDLYRAAGDEGRATESAWLAEEWRALTPLDAPVFGPAAALEEDPPAPADGNDGMLARSAAALAESESARRTLGELLGAAELQVTPPATN